MSKVAVVGAGTMGHGIAQVAALAGYETALTDSNAAVLRTAPARIEKNLEGGVTRGKITEGTASEAMCRIEVLGDLEAAVTDADLVIEAVIEDLGIKRDLFARLDSLTVSSAVLATNTSALSVAAIAAATTRPDRVLGMHFFNPVHIMKLVELVRHDRTGDDSLARAREAVTRMGKQPIVVTDSPGFASSRLGVVLGLEAMRMVEQGVASPADIDKALELGYGHPMGPLKVSDLVGLDVRLAIADYLHQQLKQPHYEPPRLLREKVAAGELGKKTGKGFYEWPLKK
jgi:3-hydroxybutyryl-CoA dehydrogenase